MSSRPRDRRRERFEARERQRQGKKRSQRGKLLIRAGLILIVVAIGGFIGFRTLASAPGDFYPNQGQEHIARGAAHLAYNSVPPTSGPHYNDAGAPVPWGIYETPLLNEVEVHNLEHGGIEIQYNCSDSCPDLCQHLEDFYNRWVPANPLEEWPNSSKIVVAPYPSVPERIALTAWTRLLKMDTWDEAKAIEFINYYRNHGPEDIG